MGAILDADTAADAADLADLADFAALCLGDAGNMSLVVGGNNSDDVSGACAYALAASDTSIAVYNSLAVNNGDCIVGADLCAGAVTQASEVALEGTAGNLHSCEAVDSAYVVILTAGIVAAGASDVCGHLDGFACFYAHDLSDLLSGFSTADRAGVDSSFAANNSFCKVCTTCVAATTAVCAGEAFLYHGDTLVLFDSKDLGADSKEQTKQEAEDSEC